MMVLLRFRKISISLWVIIEIIVVIVDTGDLFHQKTAFPIPNCLVPPLLRYPTFYLSGPIFVTGRDDIKSPETYLVIVLPSSWPHLQTWRTALFLYTASQDGQVVDPLIPGILLSLDKVHLKFSSN